MLVWIKGGVIDTPGALCWQPTPLLGLAYIYIYIQLDGPMSSLQRPSGRRRDYGSKQPKRHGKCGVHAKSEPLSLEPSFTAVGAVLPSNAYKCFHLHPHDPPRESFHGCLSSLKTPPTRTTTQKKKDQKPKPHFSFEEFSCGFCCCCRASKPCSLLFRALIMLSSVTSLHLKPRL